MGNIEGKGNTLYYAVLKELSHEIRSTRKGFAWIGLVYNKSIWYSQFKTLPPAIGLPQANLKNSRKFR